MVKNVQKFKISPSKISELLKCPLCLWLFYHQGLKRPEGLRSTLMNSLDLLFKNYFDKYRQEEKLPPEISNKIKERLFTDFEKLKNWRNAFKGLEAEFPEFDIILKGAIDELLVTYDNKYIPFDFKTRGFALKEDTYTYYQDQLDLYALLLEKNNLPPANFAYLLFFYPVDYNQSFSKFESELIKVEINPDRGYKILKNVFKIINSEKPLAYHDCEFCSYRFNSQN